jgi:hypothetical protein
MPQLTPMAYILNMSSGTTITTSLLTLTPSYFIAIMTIISWFDLKKHSHTGIKRLTALSLSMVLIPVMATLPVTNLNRVTDEGIQAVAEQVADSGVWVTPTLIAKDIIERINTDEYHQLVSRPELNLMGAIYQDFWINHSERKWLVIQLNRINSNHNAVLSKLTKALYEAKVPMLTGTDAGIPFVWPGESMSDEMKLLKRVGLSNVDILKMSTANAALYIENDITKGQVLANSPANLLLLNADPLKDIQNIKQVEGVVIKGQWQDIEKMKLELSQIAKNNQTQLAIKE